MCGQQDQTSASKVVHHVTPSLLAPSHSGLCFQGRQSNRHADIHTLSCTKTHLQRHVHICSHADTQKCTHQDMQSCRHTAMHTPGDADAELDMQ